MNNSSIELFEGTRYKLTLNVTGVEDFNDYVVYGFIQAIGKCDKTAIPFTVEEA